MESNLTGDVGRNECSTKDIDEFRGHVYATSYSVITVLGLLGNGFALAVLIRTYRQSSPFHVYMMNLAVSDLLFVMTLPLRVLYYVNQGEWKQGDFLCRISSYALYVNLYCSIHFLVAMSVTRFLAIVFPVLNLRLATVTRARLVCVGIWAFICLTNSPFLMSGQKTDPVTGKIKCFEPPSVNGKGLFKLVTINYISVATGFTLPFLIILICYAGIIRALLSRDNSARRQRGVSSRAIRMIVIVLVTFLVCFLPYHVQRTVHLSFLSRESATCSEKLAMQKSVVVTMCLAASNSCFDPLLYFFSGEGFRTRWSSLRKRKMKNASSGSRVARINAAAASEAAETHQLNRACS
ncbi:cysteinyl leukotriene receptor 1-like [Pseudoliparis swirei]|uniref:cysteinyl leukotriene receptor 1-like n=1 Tax=Pseudoliparis swirei TaxID=2059687 RepID=UPI0024BEA4B4|nr:cysteinyl leukotriene receptor 1-like [Pseudoliparis swirei]